MEHLINMNLLPVGAKGVVQKMDAGGHIRRRFQDMGLVEGTTVKCVGRSPLGDPSAYFIKGAIIAIRAEDCENIIISIHNAGGKCKDE